jgi:hypothetical protein
LVGEGRLDEGGARGPIATVFVSDPTAEAERVARELRAAGYAVVDVPLSMLVARVAVQHPRIILVDADSEGALDIVSRMRELPDADDIHVLFLARPGGAVATPEQALAHEGSGLFVRPVEIPALVRKVEALTGDTPGARPAGASEEDAVSSSIPPPSIPGASKKRASVPPSLAPPSMRAAAPVEPRSGAVSSRLSVRTSRMPSEPPTSSSGPPRRIAGLAPPVSPELQQLLADAEQRAVGGTESESIRPSPEDEIEAVLPADMLASLDEPMEEEDDDDEALGPARSALSSLGAREATHDGGGSRTTGATGVGSTPTTGSSARVSAARSQTSEVPLGSGTGETHGTHPGATGAGMSTTGSERAERSPIVPSRQGPMPALESVPPPTAWSPPVPLPPLGEDEDLLSGLPPAMSTQLPALLAQGDALRVVARSIAQQSSITLCVAAPEAERRIVLREGDLVTAASTSEDESLLAFLGARGDLPKETVRRLAAKFPPFGRHGGAALVARGYLRQDQMWPTLRAHAEWLLAHVLQTQAARLIVEADPPGRLAGEPSVFGGSSGASVFVEVVRRILAPADAFELLGGAAARLAEGPQARMLAECSLAPTELDLLSTSSGRALGEVLGAAPDGDLATVIFALSQLGVLEVMRGVGGEPGLDEAGGASSAGVAALDTEAIRERVRARMHLVDDGDYFALLGVEHDATGYEIRRAFLELRRAFDPSRVLTPEIIDLAEDVRKITVVLEEAYDILKDGARRERYRRAIEAVPSG